MPNPVIKKILEGAEVRTAILTEASKNDVKSLIVTINATENESERENLCDQLRRMLYSLFDGVDKYSYSGRTIRDEYINFDSNCGLSYVDASIDIEPIADYVVEKGIDPETFSLSDASSIMNAEFDERDEYWDDLIDDDFYVKKGDDPQDVIDLIWSLKAGDTGEKEFKADLKNYVVE